MPVWWESPDDPDALGTKYADNGHELMQVRRDVVTFVTYMADGRMQLQQRSFVSADGWYINNPGYLSINGGEMESDDIHVDLRREAMEELGVDIGGNFSEVGVVYDPTHGRCNHVFFLTKGYDTLLAEQHGVEAAIRALCTPEGIGRAFMWRADVEVAMAANRLTGISVKILETFPKLMPPSRPQ